MLTPYLPYPPVSGGRSRSYNLIKHLGDDYAVTLICFGRPEEQQFDLTPLRELCDLTVIDRDPSPGTLKAALLSLTSIQPITMRLYTSPAFREAARQALESGDFDLVHVESFYMRQNLPDDLKLPVLLAEPSIEFMAWRKYARVAQPIYQRPAVALEALKMRVFEPLEWRKVALVGVTSEVDAGVVARVAPGIPIAPTPNGVDIDHFQAGRNPRDPDNAVYMGDYKYFPNTDAIVYFAQAILPLIRAQRPDFTLTALGKDPTAEMLLLSRDPASGIRVMGLVDDTRPYLQHAGVFICPQRSGGGTRYKLLEAMASGCPVVATSIGAEGLIAPGDTHMLIADSPEAFAEAVMNVLDDPELAEQLSRDAREWVVQHHSWETSVACLKEAYTQMEAPGDSD